MKGEEIKEVVKEKYGAAARRVSQGTKTSCCGPAPAVESSCCSGTAAEGILSARDPVTSDLYGAGEKALLPAAAVNASLGCGNPTALAELKPGETVSTSAPGAASTCSSRREGSVPRGGSTAST